MQKYFPLEFARDNFVFKGLEAYLLFYYVNLIDLSFQGGEGSPNLRSPSRSANVGLIVSGNKFDMQNANLDILFL